MLSNKIISISILLFCSSLWAQTSFKKAYVTGKILDKTTSKPMEFVTISAFKSDTNKLISGTTTDGSGNFSLEINNGTYSIKIEYMGYKTKTITQQNIAGDTNLGSILLEEDAKEIEAVEIRAEKTTVEIKLDKKVYNLGKDLMVKGGTVSDVLDNIPSVTVDVEGNISLRGNENVRVLIDGRPSNAVSINDALKMLPADAVDKVEVITNPSARYDAEGGAGILNIVLKKGKTKGFSGTFITNTGYPDNHGISGTLNYKTQKINLFTNQSVNYRNNPGFSEFNTKYLNSDNSARSYIDEHRDNSRINKGYNASFGFDWYLTKNATWTNSINYRDNSGDNEEDVDFNNYNANKIFTFYRNRISNENQTENNVEYNSNLVVNFKKTGHKLTADLSISDSNNNNNATIKDKTTLNNTLNIDVTKNNQNQKRSLAQIDYVYPITDNIQFEAGYRGSFINQKTDYAVINNGIINTTFTNILEYIENVNALYSQIGFKLNKLSMLYGLRFEDSDIQINQYTTSQFKTKLYNNFFPSAFFTYELGEGNNLSLNYSKRINRPRGRQINPFSTFSSNINLFRGNPDLDPSLTDAIDFGFLKKMGKITLSSSVYYNYTKNSTQFVRFVEGVNPDNIPITTTSFVNIGEEIRSGFEFTINYNPYKWWRINSNFNVFKAETKGDFTYTYFDTNNTSITKTQNLDNSASSWFTRLNSKITLPNKIDWQTNLTFNGRQRNAQGMVKGIFAVNLAFSKDIIKDKGTVALNVNDLFNSRIRRMETYIPGQIDAYGEMQWRVRQITLSFTYRFNKQKNEKEKMPKREDDGGGEF